MMDVALKRMFILNYLHYESSLFLLLQVGKAKVGVWGNGKKAR